MFEKTKDTSHKECHHERDKNLCDNYGFFLLHCSILSVDGARKVLMSTTLVKG